MKNYNKNEWNIKSIKIHKPNTNKSKNNQNMADRCTLEDAFNSPWSNVFDSDKNVCIEVYAMPLVMLVNNAIDCIICAIVALLMTFEAISCILPFLVPSLCHSISVYTIFNNYSNNK